MTEQGGPPEWVDLYRLAMLELDLGLLRQRIDAARKAIEKQRASPSSASGAVGSQSIQDALNNLRILEKELTVTPRDRHVHPELAGKYVAIVDSARRYIAVTDGICELVGFSRAELLTKKIDDLTAPDLRESVPGKFRQYVDLGVLTGTHRLQHRNGQILSIRYEARVFPDGCLVSRWEPE